MSGVVLPSGRTIRWKGLNEPKSPGRIVASNSLSGFRTARTGSHVDVAIARGNVCGVAHGGDQIIPLTGFVLSVPRECGNPASRPGAKMVCP